MKKTEFVGNEHAVRRFGIRLRLSPGRLIPAFLFVLLGALVLYIERSSFCGEDGAYRPGYVAAYAALCAISALLCITELRLPLKLRCALGYIFAFVLSPALVFFAVEMINSTRILSFPFLRVLGNYLCCLMVFALVYALCRSAWLTVLIGGGALLIFGIINCFVVEYRGSPILPWDLSVTAVTTAAEVSNGYSFSLTPEMFISIWGFIADVMLTKALTSQRRKELLPRFKLIERLVSSVIFVVLLILIFPVNILSSMKISVWAWNQKTSSEISGVVAGFAANIQYLMVDKPDGYSEEAVEEISEEIDELEEPETTGNPDENPTIIVVMSESMTDFSSVGDIELSEDNMPFIHSLQQSGECIWGTAYSSVYGGNTCNSEYEFLTGNTTAFLPSGSKPYQQYIDSDQTALPSILKSYGYYCTAIHPGKRTAWQRDVAYPYLGFDKFMSSPDFTVDKKLVHSLTSDASHYDQILWCMDNSESDASQFYFTVTIQNHGGYEDEDLKTTIQVKDHEGEWPKAEQYLSLTKISDNAFKDFIEELEGRDEPIVVLFFGDHWPSLESGFVSYLLGADANNLEFSDLMREYEVPFLIWANYDIEGEYVEGISINYLSTLLLSAAGLEGTDYTKYLSNLQETLPVITAIGTIDADGNLYKNGEDSPYAGLLNDYSILQYNNIFGEDGKVEELFTVNE